MRLLTGPFLALNYFMGMLRRILGRLFDPPSSSLDDIVFERLDDVPDPVPAQRGVVVSIEELTPRIPPVWLRSGNLPLQQTIEIPPAAFMESSPERPAVASLRFLAGAYPDVFRDPGLAHPDPGVDLPMPQIRDAAAMPSTIPAEIVVESEEVRETFASLADGEPDERTPEERAAEAKETSVALRGVRMPSTPAAQRAVPFESTLSELPPVRSGGAAPDSVPVSAPPALTPETSSRLRRILAAYGEPTSDDLQDALKPYVPPARATTPSLPNEPLPIQAQLARARVLPPAPELDPVLDAPFIEALEKRRDTPVENTLATEVPRDLSGFRMRFEELGLSLSRFSEVRGFVLWQGGQSSHTGDLGVDLDLAALRVRLDKMLDGGIQVQGVQDGFSSVTLNHAKGGLSVFGSGSALVAVAHQHDGLPSHLRSWMCGWVSQPLRA